MKNFTTDITNYFGKLIKTIEILDKTIINDLANLLIEARDSDKQIFIMGNGGSASTASHLACDFNKGMSYGKEKRFKIICLNDNIPTMLAYANDVSYDDMFIEQLKNFFNSGDVVIGISGSGNSTNVVRAIEWTNNNGGISVSITGFDGGILRRVSTLNFNVPIDDMQITEDIHLIINHCLMKVLQ